MRLTELGNTTTTTTHHNNPHHTTTTLHNNTHHTSHHFITTHTTHHTSKHTISSISDDTLYTLDRTHADTTYPLCIGLYYFSLNGLPFLPLLPLMLPIPSTILPSLLSCLSLFCLALSFLTLPYFVLPFLVFLCLILSCLSLSFFVLFCLALSFLIFSCLALPCLFIPSTDTSRPLSRSPAWYSSYPIGARAGWGCFHRTDKPRASGNETGLDSCVRGVGVLPPHRQAKSIR